MTTTKEQLAKWREEFETVCLGALEIVKLSNGTYADSRTEAVWQWHISSKQETEQALKDANHTLLDQFVLILDEANMYIPHNIHAKLKELLK